MPEEPYSLCCLPFFHASCISCWASLYISGHTMSVSSFILSYVRTYVCPVNPPYVMYHHMCLPATTEHSTVLTHSLNHAHMHTLTHSSHARMHGCPHAQTTHLMSEHKCPKSFPVDATILSNDSLPKPLHYTGEGRCSRSVRSMPQLCSETQHSHSIPQLCSET